jgi:NAD(P)-dependent dehydrogenase (short-subunit alcohol dehydrogenase family)
MGRLDNKVMLVTGSGRGLGRSCAEISAREGAKVVVVDINTENGDETIRLIKNAGGEAIFVRADVSSSVDVQAMVRAAEETYGGLDCAINNAMRPTEFRAFADVTEDDWDRSIAVNLKGVFLCIKYELQAMLRRGGGAIISIGSGNEHAAAPGCTAYIAAKRGLLGLTAVAALEYGDKNIRVNAVGPGVMKTPAMHNTVEENPRHIEFLKSLSPMGRFADPAEVAKAAVWLCTDEASFVTGHTLVADGGASAGKVFKNVV